MARTSRWQREGQGFKSPRVHIVRTDIAFFLLYLYTDLMVHTDTLTKTSNHDLQIEQLIQSAFARTKAKFLSYFLAFVLTYAFIIATIIVGALVVALHYFIYAVTASYAITMTSAVISGVLFFVGFIYVSCWGQLAMVDIMITDTKTGVIESFKKVRPLIWGFLGYSIMAGLFMFGLMPLGVLSVGIILILWSIWSIFGAFVYLEYKKKGLENLWMSRDIINQNFWGIFGRLALVYFGFIVLVLLISSFAQEAAWVNAANGILSVVISPFLISYFYEIYRNIKHPKTAQKPIVWITLSILGWIIMIGSVIALASFVSQIMPDIMNNMEKEMILRQAYNI